MLWLHAMIALPRPLPQFWPRRDAAKTPDCTDKTRHADPLFIHDAVTPLRDGTVLLAILRAQRACKDS
jgi:hypothetical protein